MPSDDPELKAVEARLVAFVRCVLAKAESDSEFAGQLKDLFLSDNLRGALRSKGVKKTKRAVFDPVAFLSEHGPESLHHELGGRPTSELAEIARKHRVVATKALKGMEREELIDKLLTHAEQKLKQGGVFLRPEAKVETPVSETPLGDHSA